jgi:uncharacterized membrane protein
MNKQSDDEYETLSFCQCIIKKTVSVWGWLYDQFVSRLLLPIVIGVLAVLVIVGVVVFVQALISMYGDAVISFVGGINPIIWLIVGIVLAIQAYATIWCINYRRQKQKEKKDLTCPGDE